MWLGTFTGDADATEVAIALRTRAEVVTGNERHFRRVPELR